jgi:hypothetical protein
MSRYSLSLPNFDAIWPKIPSDAFGIGKINWTAVPPGLFNGLFHRPHLVAMAMPADMFRSVTAVSKRTSAPVPVERALYRHEIEEIAELVAAQMLRARRQGRHPTVDVEFVEAAVEVAPFTNDQLERSSKRGRPSKVDHLVHEMKRRAASNELCMTYEEELKHLRAWMKSHLPPHRRPKMKTLYNESATLKAAYNELKTARNVL